VTPVAPVATVAPAVAPVATVAPAVAPAATAAAQIQPGGVHTMLPLSGEFVVTANQDDHSLSMIPIGAAAVAVTVPLDLAPKAVGTTPNSDVVFANDGVPSTHSLAVVSLNASTEDVRSTSAANLPTSPPRASIARPRRCW
jgi:hypothetical protein